MNPYNSPDYTFPLFNQKQKSGNSNSIFQLINPHNVKKLPVAKRTLFYLINLIIIIVVSFFLGEIICRFHAFGWEAFKFKKTNSFVSIGYSGYLQPAEDQHVWYELKPDIDGLFKMHIIRTNSRGLRDQEYSFKKPPNTYRVAVIGDSFTFGDGVNAEDTYHAILEKKLNGLSDSTKVEFINFGIAGYDLLNYLGVMEAKAMAYDPDLILVGFCGNNDDDLPEARQYNEPFTGYRYVEWSWAVQRFQIFRTVANYMTIRRRKRNELANDEQSERKKQFVRDMFGEFRRVKTEHDIPLMVFYLSMADAAPEKAKLVAGLCKENGFPFIDSSPVVDGLDDISEYWFHDSDHHPNEKMHRIYADILLKSFVEVQLPEKKIAQLGYIKLPGFK
ncbi:MAG TPA: SGNH/GDSL hydrolase family protein [Bacteroidetes bacterium]|nr:SGNH/GDSL hydrolase family protein [Bacteroidota bacterium]